MSDQENIPPITFKLKIPAKGSAKPPTTKQSKPKPPAKPPKQTKRSAANSAELIRVLMEQQAAGNQADNAWKGCVWTATELALRDSELISGGAKKDAKKCNGHWDKLKAEFLAVQHLRGMSGWSWDEARHRVTAPDDIWDAHIAAHSEDKKWCMQSFPLYDDILPLVKGRHATGELAWHILEMHGSSAAGSDHGDGVEENGPVPQDTTGDEDELISNWSLLPPPMKRAVTPPPTISVSTTKCVRTSKATGAGAVSDVADALRDIAAQFNADSATDLNLTHDQQLKVLHLFRDDIAVADAYLAIDDAELRTEFILGAL
ncbi:hypothetical protein PILCRDRAFT_10571 [Piloderma croceum F 1598]|uniref:Myb/SANT-like domain-containing protein n=1 Tax=Piloderma croceum (strain F 1598) TaxID=765440 RepID=A0A0C3AYR9_PILCF|nr:hypothetical protein PILCRDRAFT_10571 [Piloderma croceum F 1598]